MNRLFFLLTLCILLPACTIADNNETPSDDNVEVASITVKSSTALTVGATETLSATVLPENATDKSVTWSTNDPSVVSVDESTGEIRGESPGAAVILATAADGSGKTATCAVTVSAASVPVTGVNLPAEFLTLTEGDTHQMMADVLPSNATNQNVTWSSDFPNVVSVNSGTGLVTAIAPGFATITVTTADGNYTASRIVIVNAIPPPIVNSQITMVSIGSGKVSIVLLGTGEATIDWGVSGMRSVTQTFPIGGMMMVENTYLDTASHTITVSGDITGLMCSLGRLTYLNASGCSALTELSLLLNPLTALDVSGCTSLKKLNCSNNELTTLNISGCIALKELECYSNNLTALDMRECTELTELSCYSNQLTELSVSGLAKLSILSCGGNELIDLNVIGCTALTYLYCWGNKLTNLDVNGCPLLIWLECDINQLTDIHVEGCSALTMLDCQHNRLSAMQLDKLFASLNSIALNKSIYIFGNSGMDECNTRIAEDRGWYVSKWQRF